MKKQIQRILCRLLALAILAWVMTGCRQPVPEQAADSTGASAVSEPAQSTPNPPVSPLPPEPTEESAALPGEQTAPPATEPPTEATSPSDAVLPTELAAVHTKKPIPSVASDSGVPKISAKKAFVYDCGSEKYLYMLGEPTDRIYPASITKLFNAYVVLQYLDPQSILTVGDERGLVQPDASVAGLEQGDSLTVEALLQCLLLPSGADAAYTLAASAGWVIAGDSGLSAGEAVQVFMEEMNRQAAALGMRDTHFVTPDGYPDSDHYMSIPAFLILAKLCLQNDTIREAVKTCRTTVSLLSGKTLTLNNMNKMLDANSGYYRQEACGLKTGFSSASGACVLAAYWVEDRYVIVGVFGSSSLNGRFDDANALFDAFF